MPHPLGVPCKSDYLELVELCKLATFVSDFGVGGRFVSSTIGGRFHWRFQTSPCGQNVDKYVGKDSLELQERIARHGKINTDSDERAARVARLIQVGLPACDDSLGSIVHALAQAGAFRLHACVVGTVAFQTYVGLLGAALPTSEMRTFDLDIAQFHSLSIAVGDTTQSIADILFSVDKSFRPVPHLSSPLVVAAFANDAGFRVEFLTPNRSKEEHEAHPSRLRALGGVSAHAFRYLDFLIHNPIPAVLLYNCGVLVNVPRPEHFAVHKLIVATQRRGDLLKAQRDLAQAASLIEVLSATNYDALFAAWSEAQNRGPMWRKALSEGTARLPARVGPAIVSLMRQSKLPRSTGSDTGS